MFGLAIKYKLLFAIDDDAQFVSSLILKYCQFTREGAETHTHTQNELWERMYQQRKRESGRKMNDT